MRVHVWFKGQLDIDMPNVAPESDEWLETFVVAFCAKMTMLTEDEVVNDIDVYETQVMSA